MRSKAQIRAEARARRRELFGPAQEGTTPERGAAFALAVRAWLASLTAPVHNVALYLATGTEPETAASIAAVHESGLKVWLPVCLPDHELGWVVWTPDLQLRRSALAPVWEPDGPVVSGPSVLSASGLDALILPATSVDVAGNRVGQGGGYYDRFLAALDASAGGRRIPRAAMVYAHEVLAAGSFAVEATDKAVDAILTEQGVLSAPSIRASHC